MLVPLSLSPPLCSLLSPIRHSFHAAGQVQDFMRNMGLGLVADQLADLKLGELLNTPPPGLDEAVAIAKVWRGGRGGGRRGAGLGRPTFPCP